MALLLSVGLTACTTPDWVRLVDQAELATIMYSIGDGYCSAVSIAPDLYLTADHCLEYDETSRPTFPQVPIEIVRRDFQADLALLRIPLNRPWLRVLLTDPKRGTPVGLLGYVDKALFFSVGTVARYSDIEDGGRKHTVLLASLWSYPGESGAPLLSESGLAGINEGVITKRAEISLMIPASTIRAFCGDVLLLYDQGVRVPDPSPHLSEKHPRWSAPSVFY